MSAVKKMMLTCAACALIFVACKNSNSPEAVSEKFLISFCHLDYETAKSLSTKNTWEMLDIMASFTDNIPESQRTHLFDKLKLEITDKQKESDSTVIVTFQSDPKILPFNKLRLQRTEDRNGRVRWKVDISTLDLIGNEELRIEDATKPMGRGTPARTDSITLDRK